MESLMSFWHNTAARVLQPCLKFRKRPTRKQKQRCKSQCWFSPSTSTTPFFPDTFHSRVYFVYCRFYCSCWKPTEAFTSDGKEGEKLTKRAVASCRLCFPLPQNIAKAFPQQAGMAVQQLGPAVASVDSGWGPVGRPPCAPVGAAP